MASVTCPCYQERKDSGGFWYWIYYASNGEGDRSQQRKLCAP
ncbi:MAG: hypothetical protein JWM75_1921 [Sphingomonas bacterium]|nr:hypothetical protein [Sphingomonas bacterium]